MGCRAVHRFWKSSRSRIRATVMREQRRDQPVGAERREPAAVELDPGLVRIQDPEGLTRVGRRVRLDLFPRELRPGRLLPGGVADHPREVPDDEDDPVPGLLELTHLAQDDRVPEVDVRSGGVEPDLDGEGTPGELSAELPLFDQVHGAAAQDVQLRRGRTHGGPGLYGPEPVKAF